ncbi:MAG: hypothetical protein ACRC9L_00435 [Brevinema sp.]
MSISLNRLIYSPKFMVSTAIILFAISIFVNYIATVGGMAVKKVSELYPTPVTPLGFTFSIWGVIYLLALLTIVVWVIYAWNRSSFFESHRYSVTYFNLVTILNSLWIISWTNLLIPLSWLFIVGMWVLLFFQDRIRSGLPISDIGWKAVVPRIFFLTYFGWITIALLLNTLVLIQYTGYSLDGPILQKMIPIALSVVVILGIWYGLKGALPYTITVLWALVGIYIQKFHTSGGSWDSLGVLIAVLGLLVVVVWKTTTLLKHH